MSAPDRPRRCPWERDAVAALQGELSAPRRAAFVEHLDGCPTCQAFVADAREVLASLARAGPAGWTAAARPSRGTRGPVRAAAWGLACAAALLLGVVLSLQQPEGGPDAAPPSPAVADGGDPAGWLAASLGSDGTWDASLWHGLRAHGVAMHGMALLALATSDEAPAHAEQVLRAGRWLLARQGPDGELGLGSGAGLDHSLATAALLEAWRLTGADDLREGAVRAVAWLRTLPGQAGRPLPGGPAAAPWIDATLARADALGWPDLGSGTAPGDSPSPDSGPGSRPVAPLLAAAALGPTRPESVAAVGDLFAASLAALSPVGR